MQKLTEKACDEKILTIVHFSINFYETRPKLPKKLAKGLLNNILSTCFNNVYIKWQLM